MAIKQSGKELFQGWFSRFKPDVAVEADMKISEEFCPSDFDRPCVTVCFSETCTCGCGEIRVALEKEIANKGLPLHVGTMKTACPGTCADGPFVGFPKKQIFYSRVKTEYIPDIIEESLQKGRVIFDILYLTPYRSYRSDVLFNDDEEYLIAIDDRMCMVSLADYFLKFEEGISCGKCVPCRQGNMRLRKVLKGIIEGKGKIEDIEELKSICDAMRLAAYCDFAKTTSMPLLLALKYFENEFVEHIEKKVCCSGECHGLKKGTEASEEKEGKEAAAA